MNTAGSAGFNQTIPNKIWLPAGTLRVYEDPTVIRQKKEKKMNWFRKKFMEWSRRAWEDNQIAREENDGLVKSTRNDSLSHGHKSIRFTLYSAGGGHVIEYHVSDRQNEHWPVLTIVPHGEDIGTAVGHILAIEALRS